MKNWESQYGPGWSQRCMMKDHIHPHKITKAPRRFLVLCVISLLSIQLSTPTGFMPGAILDGQLIKPCPNSFPKYISDILESSHHHHDEETEVEQGCAFASQLSDPIFVTQNFRRTASKTHSTTRLKKKIPPNVLS